MNNFGWNYDARQYQSSSLYGSYSRGLWRGSNVQSYHYQMPHSAFQNAYTYGSKKTGAHYFIHHHSQLNEGSQRQKDVVLSSSFSPSPNNKNTTTTTNPVLEEETAEKLISSSTASISSPSTAVDETRPSVSSDVLDEMEYILSSISTNLTYGTNGLYLATTGSPQTHSNYQVSSGHCYIAPATSYAQWRGQQPQSQINYYSNHVRSSSIYSSDDSDNIKSTIDVDNRGTASISGSKQKDDLTEIVNQVISAVDSQTPNNPIPQSRPAQNTTTQHRMIKPKPPGLCSSPSSGNLCHNCGSIVSNVLTHCQLCGESLQMEDSKSKSKPSGTHNLKPRNVGIVEPRIVVKTPSRKDSPLKRAYPSSSSLPSPPAKVPYLENKRSDGKKIEPPKIACHLKKDSGNYYESDQIPSQTRIAFQPNETKKFIICSINGCTFTTNKPERMGRHVTSHSAKDSSDGGGKTFQCPDCGAKFFSMAKMLRHDRKVHTGVKDYECRLCEAEVTDIVGHSKVHREEKNIQCKECDLIFRHRSSYVRHLSQHILRYDSPEESCLTSSSSSSLDTNGHDLETPKSGVISISLDKPEIPFSIQLPEIREPASLESNLTICSETESTLAHEALYNSDYSSPLPSSSDSGISSNFNSPIYSDSNAVPQPSPIETFENNDLPNILTESLFEPTDGHETSTRIPFEFNVDLFNDDSICMPNEEMTKALSETPNSSKESPSSFCETSKRSDSTKNEFFCQGIEKSDKENCNSDESYNPNEIEIAKIQEVVEKELDKISNKSDVIGNDVDLVNDCESLKDESIENSDANNEYTELSNPAEVKDVEKEYNSEAIQTEIPNSDTNITQTDSQKLTSHPSSRSTNVTKGLENEKKAVIPTVQKGRLINDDYLKRVAKMIHGIEVSRGNPKLRDSRKGKRRKVSLKEIEDNFKAKVQGFIEQLKCIREDRTKKEENFSCNKCGRVYKFENFFKVHKRRCE